MVPNSDSQSPSPKNEFTPDGRQMRHLSTGPTCKGKCPSLYFCEHHALLIIDTSRLGEYVPRWSSHRAVQPLGQRDR